MVKRDVKGIAKVTAKGRTYWYAWRGGPRLRGQEGSPEFWQSYNEAIADRQMPDKSKFRALVADYRGSIATSKSRYKHEAVIPIYDALREVLDQIPKRSTRVLTNTRRLPWTRNSFTGAFTRAKKTAGMADRNLHFHDLRGTAATKFYVAGLSKRVIGEILGWSEDNVEKIINRYVDRTAATKAIIRQLNARHNEQ